MRLGIEPLAARLAATRALDDEAAGIAEAFAGMEAGVDDQAAYLAADLQFHDSDPGRVPQRAPGVISEAFSTASCRATFKLTTTSEAIPPQSASAPPGDPRRDRRPGRSSSRRGDRAHSSPTRRRTSSGSTRMDRESLSSLTRRRARTSRSASGTTTSIRPPAASTADPGGTVFPAKPSQWIGTSRRAPIASARSTASAASMLPTMPRASRSASRPLIGRNATSIPSGSRASPGLVGDDRVAGVVERHSVTEGVADEARAAADRTAVTVRILGARRRGTPATTFSSSPSRSTSSCGLHELESGAGHNAFDERRRAAAGRTTRPSGERSRRTREEREIEVVEVLVRDERPVDAVRGELERRRRHEPVVVRAEPRIDDDARTVASRCGSPPGRAT